MKVVSLLRMPRARGLFRSCVVQSPGGRVLSAEDGAGQTRTVLSGARADELSIRTAPIARILEGQAAVSAEGFGPSPVADGEGLIGEGDGDLMPEVSILVGSTVHDWSLLVAGRPWYAALDRASVPQAVARALPFAGPDVVERHRDAAGDESAPLLYSRIMADHSFGAAADHLAEGRSARGSVVFHYRFAYETTELPGLLGATHCLEIPFVFRTARWSALAGTADPELETTVSEAWIAFAESGSPGPQWRPYAPSERASMVIGSGPWEMTSIEDPRGRRGVFEA